MAWKRHVRELRDLQSIFQRPVTENLSLTADSKIVDLLLLRGGGYRRSIPALRLVYYGTKASSKMESDYKAGEKIVMRAKLSIVSSRSQSSLWKGKSHHRSRRNGNIVPANDALDAQRLKLPR